MKYQSIKKNILNDYNKPVFLLGNGPSLTKINLYNLFDYITVGVNAVYYTGFSPTFVCISDYTILQKYQLEHIFGCKYSKYILRKDIYIRKKKYIDRIIDSHRLYLVELIDVDIMNNQIQDFDPDFKYFNVSYSVMMDLAIPLLKFLGAKKIYMLGIDNNNFTQHSYDHRLNHINNDLPNPRNISNYTEDFQAQDLDNRYQKVYSIFKNNNTDGEIINCNPNSCLTTFPKLELTDINLYKNVKIDDIEYKIVSIMINNIKTNFMIVNGNIPTKNPNIILVSLLCMNNNFNYLKCQGDQLVIEPYKMEPIYSHQTTFYIENTDNGYSFRCYQYPDHFILKRDNYTKLSTYSIKNSNFCDISHQLVDLKTLYNIIKFNINNTEEEFIIVNGCLNYKTTVSFRWLKYPVNYFRLYHKTFTINPFQNHKKYLYDCSFILRQNTNGCFLETTKFQNIYINYDINQKLIVSKEPHYFNILKANTNLKNITNNLHTITTNLQTINNLETTNTNNLETTNTNNLETINTSNL